MLRYFTTGESHGEALVAFISGLPAGLAVDQAFLDHELWRRQQGLKTEIANLKRDLEAAAK